MLSDARWGVEPVMGQEDIFILAITLQKADQEPLEPRRKQTGKRDQRGSKHWECAERTHPMASRLVSLPGETQPANPNAPPPYLRSPIPGFRTRTADAANPHEPCGATDSLSIPSHRNPIRPPSWLCRPLYSSGDSVPGSATWEPTGFRTRSPPKWDEHPERVQAPHRMHTETNEVPARCVFGSPKRAGSEAEKASVQFDASDTDAQTESCAKSSAPDGRAWALRVGRPQSDRIVAGNIRPG